jgi:putative membrane protein
MAAQIAPAYRTIRRLAIHTSILGALLTFSSTVWYPAYIQTARLWSVDPLEDQEVGGLIMWIPAGLIYVLGGLALFVEWLRESERATQTLIGNRRSEYAA